MSGLPADKPQIISVRPEMTRVLLAQTGLDHEILRDLVYGFYDKIRADAVLGPIFDSRISDWPSHLEKMVAFWSSVALMTGAYHGAPVPAHVQLPVNWTHFERWLTLFCQTAHAVCPPEGAIHVIERAERIARSLNMAIEDNARTDPKAIPTMN